MPCQPAGSAAAAAVSSQPAWSTLPVDIYNAYPRLPSVHEQQLEVALVVRLGWRQWHVGRPVPLCDLTVKDATSLQLGPLRAARKEKFSQFAAEALPAQPARVASGVGCIHKAQRQLWKLQWDNSYKELYWRLPLDGLCTAARLHNPHDMCLCGSPQPGRQHHFWQCPVALAVVQTILDNMPSAWCTRSVNRPALLMKHIWLMQPPPGTRRLHPGMWRVVCLAALHAMDVGRKAANELRLQQRQASVAPTTPCPRGQQQVTSLLQPAPLTNAQQHHNQSVQQRQQQQWQQLAVPRLAEAKLQAVARFWELLADFIIMHAAPDAWVPDVAVDHPFLCREPLINHLVLASRSV